MLPNILAVAAYALLVIYIGHRGMRKTNTYDDFLLGGRKIGPWMTAFSYGTAYFSAVLLIGFAGKLGWGFGLSALWIALGNTLIGVLGVWLLLGNRIKKAAGRYNVKTMPEFLEARFQSPFMKGYTALAIFLFFIPYTAAVFMGLSYLFESTFQLPYSWALLIMGVFTGVYLIMGGYKSMAMIDVIFGVVMTLGVLILLWFNIQKGGGIPNIVDSLRAIQPKLAGPVGPPGILPLLSLVFLTSVAPFAMPQLLQKFYAIRDRKAVKIGTVASTLFALLVTGIAYFSGALTRIFLSPSSNPDAFTEGGAPIFDALMPELLVNVIPGALTVVILLLVLSASMSTLAALVLVSSSTVTKDFYHGFVNRTASDKKLTALGRLSSGFFIVLSVILAWFEPAVIVTILSISWGAIASVFLGPFIWGILSNKLGRTGAITSSISGLAVCLILFFSWDSKMVPQAASLGMLVSLVVPGFFVLFRRGKAA
ncbi:MAG: sodium:solute symporter [Candidatus Aegiribacteria sp.]|nr:sodium:solute symporter [Candidatus Aegiribacteria sp.]MBD3294363.1 sodium:solute symporter [Candidatus Fermentibacteria bacterium]